MSRHHARWGLSSQQPPPVSASPWPCAGLSRGGRFTRIKARAQPSPGAPLSSSWAPAGRARPPQTCPEGHPLTALCPESLGLAIAGSQARRCPPTALPGGSVLPQGQAWGATLGDADPPDRKNFLYLGPAMGCRDRLPSPPGVGVGAHTHNRVTHTHTPHTLDTYTHPTNIVHACTRHTAHTTHTP